MASHGLSRKPYLEFVMREKFLIRSEKAATYYSLLLRLRLRSTTRFVQLDWLLITISILTPLPFERLRPKVDKLS